mmetsp:Transcript_16136/g.43467  ORF Transcript_16136/g.43467 Transcript_16136/m.43467 type:complete len:110 (-) Transcript_16136:28-357(-)
MCKPRRETHVTSLHYYIEAAPFPLKRANLFLLVESVHHANTAKHLRACGGSIVAMKKKNICARLQSEVLTEAHQSSKASARTMPPTNPATPAPAAAIPGVMPELRGGSP